VDKLVLAPDPACYGKSIDTPVAPDESPAAQLRDIGRFLASFSSSLTQVGTSTLRPSRAIHAYFGPIDLDFTLRQAPICSPPPEMGVLGVCEGGRLAPIQNT
jgi:hypothetical protein